MSPDQCKFFEIDTVLLRACEDGARAQLWTRPDYGFINIYLEGFDLGKGKIATLKKDENKWLCDQLLLGHCIYAEIKKESDLKFKIEFKRISEAEALKAVADARVVSESTQGKLEIAENNLRIIKINKLLAPYKPTLLTIPCALRTPVPVKLPFGAILGLRPRSAHHYAAPNDPVAVFISAEGLGSAYLKASSDIKTKILKAYFNGYHVAARITGEATGPFSHGLAAVWDEYEMPAEVALTPQGAQT
ncbi:hypothetical protein ACLB1G_21770 [Oxalobacteraceae bacterium A2-2]